MIKRFYLFIIASIVLACMAGCGVDLNLNIAFPPPKPSIVLDARCGGGGG